MLVLYRANVFTNKHASMETNAAQPDHAECRLCELVRSILKFYLERESLNITHLYILHFPRENCVFTYSSLGGNVY